MNGQDFLNYKNWVVVGDILNTEKYAWTIMNRLKAEGYNVVGVNPKGGSSEVYKDLKSVPYKIDVIDLCIHPTKGINFVKEAKELNIDKIMIQPGARTSEILDYCKENEISALQSCVLVELSNKL